MRNRLFLSLWLLACSLYAAGQTRHEDAPTVPFRIDTIGTGERIMLDGSLNGRPYGMLFDTGAAVSLVTPEVAAECGMRPNEKPQGYIRGVGKQEVTVVVCDTVRIGDIILQHIPLYVVDMREAVRASGLDSIRAAVLLSRMKVILGNDVMRKLGCLHFDFEKGVLTVPDTLPATLPPNLSWQGTAIRLSVHHGGKPYLAFLDTGSPRSHLNYPFYARNKAWIKRQARRDTCTIRGIGGVEKVSSFRLPQVTLQVTGKYMTMAGITVITDKRGRSIHLEGDLLLGIDFIRLFRRMTIDLENMRLDGELWER